MHTCLAELLNIRDDRTADLRLDLGFHIRIERRLTIDRVRAIGDGEPKEVTLREIAALPAGEAHRLLTTVRNDGAGNNFATLYLVPDDKSETGDLKPEADEPETRDSKSEANESEISDSETSESEISELWHYRARSPRVIDGDTLDATLDLGFGIRITERLRFKGIQAPEIFGVRTSDPEFRRGMEAKGYVERRLEENDGRFRVMTTRLGKWRRWLADVHLPDASQTLNEELIGQGLADDYDTWLEKRRNRQFVRTAFDIDRDLREELEVKAKTRDMTPSQLLRRIVEEFFTP